MTATSSQGKRTRRQPLAWLRGLLSRPLKLERRGVQLHVVLGEARQPPALPTRPGEVLRQGHEALRALLTRHPDARHLLRHLSFFEQALGRHGSRALRSEVPVQVLQRAHEQLEMLLREDSTPELIALAARLERTVKDRRRAEETAAPVGMVQVSEASHSLFDEMERSWTGNIPLGASAAPPERA
ncbi:MAG: hypothetical protein KIT35_22475 [Piscinibacter sp.]|uniref:hypothetical protein n=1 Tax=Piscinibacter sp. TaxID=1903157 RepID=UPI002582C1DC|nr:hypothetical protein [Piscinibacter sp.]MCW5666607.1 hypothetical protein [Piscinibacter sp.]